MPWYMEMKGIDELNKNIDKLTRGVSPEIVEPILRDEAKGIADLAKSYAPRGPTGNLKRGIVDKTLQRKGPDDIAPSMAGIDYRVSPHAHLVEFGTSERYPRKKKVLADRKTGEFFGTHVGPMPAHPFFRPAWDARKIGMLDRIIDKLVKALEASIK